MRYGIPALLLGLSLVPLPASFAQPAANDRAASDNSAQAVPPLDLSDVSVEEAERMGAEAIDRLDASSDSDVELARALLERIKQVVEFIEGARPEHPSLDYLRGRLYAFIRRESEAVELLERFVSTRVGRNEWRAHRALGDLFVLQYPRLARNSYRTADVLKQNEPTVLNGLSQCAEKLGELAEAIGFATRAVDADGRKTIGYLQHLAELLVANQSWSDAQRVTEEAIEIARNMEKPRESLAAMEVQYKLLIELFRRRANSSPSDAESYEGLAKYLRIRAENALNIARDDAVRVLERGVENTAPNTPLSLLEQHAIALAEAGRRKEAIAGFEAILTSHPDHSSAREWLSKLRGDAKPQDAP